MVGMAGGEYGVRGFLDAYDAKTGKRAWRFWTIPGPGEPGNETGRATVGRPAPATTWVTGAFDPESNLFTGAPAIPDPTGTAMCARATTCTRTA